MGTDWHDIPGSALVSSGLEDLRVGKPSAEALLVAIGGPRLRRLGIPVPDIDEPEHRLYDLLAQHDSDAAHSQYNALIRRLVSFERALECESERTATG